MDPMNRETITNVWNAYKQVVNGEETPAQELEESKLDPVDKKAVKKDFDDRKDKDIDNDGDTDSSDEYLHKRRKAISKDIKEKKGYKYESSHKDNEDDDETVVKKKDKKGDKEYKNDEEVVEANDLEKHQQAHDYHSKMMKSASNQSEVTKHMNAVQHHAKIIKKLRNEETETESLDGIIETNRLGMRDAIMSVWEGKTYADRTKGATSKEELLSKESPKSKEFVDKHTVNDEDRGMEKGREDVSKNGGPSMQQAPVRRGDQRDNGDKKPVR